MEKWQTGFLLSVYWILLLVLNAVKGNDKVHFTVPDPRHAESESNNHIWNSLTERPPNLIPEDFKPTVLGFGELQRLQFNGSIGFSNPETIGFTTKRGPTGSICIPQLIADVTQKGQSGRIEGGFLDGQFSSCSRCCTDFNCSWRHDGSTVHIAFPKELSPRAGLHDSRDKVSSSNVLSRRKRGSDDSKAEPEVIRSEVIGLSFEFESDKKRVEYDSVGSALVIENLITKVRMYGRFEGTTYFKFTKFQTCDDPNNHEPVVPVEVDKSGKVGVAEVTLPRVGELHQVFLCLSHSGNYFKRQGEEGPDGIFVKPWLVIKLQKPLLPLWLHVSSLIVLLSLSGLFSGLNLGLMSLDKTDIKILVNTGTPVERKYAAAIAPVRNHGNFLLCCLLFSNVLVNATLTILIDDLTSGLVAVIGSTLAIVIFGEIIPQAICSRHGLAVGAKTIYITKFFMLITAPLSLPMSKVLDKILGEEIGNVYTRERLKELLRVTKDYSGLETEEVGIISGALDLKTKTVKDNLLSFEHAFMLPIDAVLDFETMAEVEYHGYSRIPVFEKDRNNIVGLLHIKQLTLLDANDKIPLRTVVEYYQNKLFFVFENTRLDYLFKVFREGSHGHMAFVQRINSEGPGDPYYETIGLLTLEDVLEELLQAEIMDESDIGKHEARMSNSVRPTSTSAQFALMRRKQKTIVELPPPLALATVQFLSTSVEPFHKDILSHSILQRLVTNCAHYIKLPKHQGSLPDVFLYEAGKPSEYFIIILEGKVEVTVGAEKLKYESGAFTTFGKDFLISTLATEKAIPTSPMTEKAELKFKRRTFTPDYTVRVVTDLHYLMIKYSAYKAAILAATIEKNNADPALTTCKNWQDEIDKILEKVVGYDDDFTDPNRKQKLSRDESFRGPNISIIEMDAVAARKISFPVIGEMRNEDDFTTTPHNSDTMVDISEVPDDEGATENSDLLPKKKVVFEV